MTTGTSAKGKTAVSSLRDTEAAEATAPASTSDDNATPPPRPRHDRGRRPPFRSTSTDRSRTDMRANGTTFARDARILVDGGWTLSEVVPVDQFLWTGHLEIVGVFWRG